MLYAEVVLRTASVSNSSLPSSKGHSFALKVTAIPETYWVLEAVRSVSNGTQNWASWFAVVLKKLLATVAQPRLVSTSADRNCACK